MNILICSIMRNSEKVIARYFNNIRKIVKGFPEHNFYLSVYENDSTDNTSKLLTMQNINDIGLFDYSIVSEVLNKPFYNSFQNGVNERLMNLAEARNKAIVAKDFYKTVDKILWIEPDVRFGLKYIEGLLSFDQPTDIYSGLNLYMMLPHENVPEHRVVLKDRVVLCDTWATRRTEHEEYGDLFEDHEINPIREVYSTFNAVCLYNAKAFRQGARFGWFNTKLGKPDCDPAVLVQNFRDLGFDKVYINQSLKCYHDWHESPIRVDMNIFDSLNLLTESDLHQFNDGVKGLINAILDNRLNAMIEFTKVE